MVAPKRYNCAVDRPVLDGWLAGASAAHPLHSFVDVPEYLDDVERMVAPLHEVGVLRLEGKRRDFRALTNQEKWMDMAAELRLASWHVQRGVEVQFGSPGTPNPDLVLPEFELGLEMTRRARGGLADLRRAVRKGCRGWKPSPKPHILVTGQPLSIRSTVLAQITHEVVDALRAGQDVVHVVLRPAARGRPAMTARISLFGGISVLPQIKYHPDAADLTVTMSDIEQLVRDCLDSPQKRAQGGAMTTVLLIDASRLSDTFWLRSADVWSRRLGTLIATDDTFTGAGLIIFPVDAEPRAAIGLRSLNHLESGRVRAWAMAMGLHVSTHE